MLEAGSIIIAESSNKGLVAESSKMKLVLFPLSFEL